MMPTDRRAIELAADRMARLDELRADLEVEAVSYGGELVTSMIVGTIAGLPAYVTSIEFRRARGG